jgi:hypothetical protein
MIHLLYNAFHYEISRCSTIQFSHRLSFTISLTPLFQPEFNQISSTFTHCNMKTSTFASAAALLSSSYAATVTFETTPCLDPSYPREQFDIELNPSGPVPKGNLKALFHLRSPVLTRTQISKPSAAYASSPPPLVSTSTPSNARPSRTSPATSLDPQSSHSLNLL